MRVFNCFEDIPIGTAVNIQHEYHSVINAYGCWNPFIATTILSDEKNFFIYLGLDKRNNLYLHYFVYKNRVLFICNNKKNWKIYEII